MPGGRDKGEGCKQKEEERHGKKKKEIIEKNGVLVMV